MTDFWETFSDMFKVIFAVVSCIFCIFIIGELIYYVSGCAEKDIQEKQEIHDCFIQEPRTKECEYVLWQYELKNTKEKKQKMTNEVATGIIIGTTMSGAIRR